MSSNRPFIFLVFVLFAGCSDDENIDAPVELPTAWLPGTYSGVFPCDGCPGIESTLWLRADGRFFFRQLYPANDFREATHAYSLGRWSSTADERAIELKAAGPKRTFSRFDRDTLLLQTDSALEHRLIRDPVTTDFTATIRMHGLMRMAGDGANFEECYTSYIVPVGKGGDFGRFRHQFRSTVGRGEAAHVELEGRFSWSDDGSPQALIIERFITVKSDGVC